MTHVAIPAGTPLAAARGRMNGDGFWLPSLSTDGVLTASSSRLRASCTASATPHADTGAWVEVIAATTKEVHGLTVALTTATASSGNATSTLLDISTGASGDEVNHIVVANLAVGYKPINDRFELPVRIPQGSRIAIRCRSLVASKQVDIEMALTTLPFGKRTPDHLVTIGADTATSKGVSLTAGGTINTKTAWTQITASTTEPFGALVIGEQGAADAALNNGTALLDIAIGASGSEVVIVNDLSLTITVNESIVAMSTRTFPVSVPLGSRLAARWAFTVNTNSLDVILYGVPRQ